MNGTSIEELRKNNGNIGGQLRDIMANDLNNGQQLPPQNIMYQYAGNQNPQTLPFNMSNPGQNQNITYQQMLQNEQPHIPQMTQADIDELARDISLNLPEDTFANVSGTGGSTSSENANSTKKENDNFVSLVYKLREPLIILIIYIIMSQPTVREVAGKYIKYIRPDDEGKVSFAGVLIYGIILATLFMLVKNIAF